MDHRLPTLPGFLIESAETLIDADGPLWATLRRLACDPGGLALDYVSGRRSVVVHPAKLLAVASAAAISTAAMVPSDRWGALYIFSVESAVSVGGGWAPWLFALVALPTMAVVLSVLFPRRHRYLEHLVVTAIYFSFVLALASCETLLVMTTGGAPVVRNTLSYLAGGSVFLYGYVTLRRFYGVGVIGGLARVILLSVTYGLVYGLVFDALL